MNGTGLLAGNRIRVSVICLLRNFLHNHRGPIYQNCLYKPGNYDSTCFTATLITTQSIFWTTTTCGVYIIASAVDALCVACIGLHYVVFSLPMTYVSLYRLYTGACIIEASFHLTRSVGRAHRSLSNVISSLRILSSCLQCNTRRITCVHCCWQLRFACWLQQLWLKQRTRRRVAVATGLVMRWPASASATCRRWMLRNMVSK